MYLIDVNCRVANSRETTLKNNDAYKVGPDPSYKSGCNLGGKIALTIT